MPYLWCETKGVTRMKKIGVLLLIFSIIILIATCVAFGFLEQITNLGFNFLPLGFCLIMLSVAGILASTMMVYLND